MRVLLALALTLICTSVFSHGSEQWISDAKLVDPVSKAFCCGPTDCSVLAPGSVERVKGGYKVNTGKWAGYDPFFVEWDHALPLSPDGNYHSLYHVRHRSNRWSDASSRRRAPYDRLTASATTPAASPR
jgi:hypothetical protein